MGAVSMALQAAIDRSGAEHIDLVQVTTIYPEGGEKQLIQVLTGLEVPSGGRPTDLGLLCQNVATATAVARAVTEGKALVERIVTVTGNGVRQPRNLLAAIGTPIEVLIEAAGGYENDAARLVLGGPMMGYPLSSDANPGGQGRQLHPGADRIRYPSATARNALHSLWRVRPGLPGPVVATGTGLAHFVTGCGTKWPIWAYVTASNAGVAILSAPATFHWWSGSAMARASCASSRRTGSGPNWPASASKPVKHGWSAKNGNAGNSVKRKNARWRMMRKRKRR